MASDSAHTQAPAEGFLPGPVLLLGAPGVGKGTQAQRLMADFGIPQISTGDILRDNIARGTDLGKSAKGLMDQGQLVPDQMVNDMVGARLTQADVQRGYILDGYPRTLGQAEWLDSHLISLEKSVGAVALPLVAVNIRVDEQELLRRITGRRICPVCKTIYNIYSKPPKKEGVCDNEGASLQHRSDDTEAAFVERMKAYNSLTAPVIEHYSHQGRFREVDGAHTVEQVTAAIESALRELRQAGE
ncbi:adenylate kinase [Edaphobacter albus]|uniref:adenylate kinase n=1 Tax=Edaphobacter sp. 4G125 TaxID=2763071 RepID=UPI001646D6F1|nr:adenylate kinase [Edaphobacter sp. 4G125]QNI36243.1 adenylate kinase [Edaphobacter sp. 4G125]